jgi:hypothetical protein
MSSIPIPGTRQRLMYLLMTLSTNELKNIARENAIPIPKYKVDLASRIANRAQYFSITINIA